MKLTKKITMAGIAALIGFFAYGCRHNGHHKHFCSNDFPENILSHADKKVKELNFNEIQQKKYSQIREQVKADMIAARNEKLQKLDEANDELAKQNPDINKLAGNFKKFHDAGHAKKADAFSRYYDQVLELYNLLDKDQQEKIIDKLRELGKHFNCR